jgi:hypothetical protein
MSQPWKAGHQDFAFFVSVLSVAEGKAFLATDEHRLTPMKSGGR